MTSSTWNDSSFPLFYKTNFESIESMGKVEGGELGGKREGRTEKDTVEWVAVGQDFFKSETNFPLHSITLNIVRRKHFYYAVIKGYQKKRYFF